MVLVVKNPATKQETWDLSSIPRWGRSPGVGHGNPLQYSCLENPMDREACWDTVHRVAKNQTWLKRLSTYSFSSELWMLSYLIHFCIYHRVTHCQIGQLILITNTALSPSGMFFECLNDAANEGWVSEANIAIIQRIVPWCLQRQIRMLVDYPSHHSSEHIYFQLEYLLRLPLHTKTQTSQVGIKSSPKSQLKYTVHLAWLLYTCKCPRHAFLAELDFGPSFTIF